MTRKFNMLIGLAVLTAMVGVAAGQQPTAPIKKATDSATASLARMEFKLADAMLGDRAGVGQAVCIDAAKGIFMTIDIPTNASAGEIKDIKLTRPGRTDGAVDAEIVGIDPEQSFTFLRVKGAHQWKALRFSRKADLEVGDQVVSVGLFAPDVGNVAYTGTGTIGAKLRLPHQLYYVTGGELTVSMSPVLTPDGRVVGLVRGERAMESRMLLGGRWMNVPTVGRYQTKFFMPVDEFAHVLADIPTLAKPRRLPWIGILRVDAMLEKNAELKGLKNVPAVLVGQIVPDTPAAKAGMKQSDVIVAVNGKPLEDLATPALVRDNFGLQLRRHKPGEVIKLTVQRSDKKKVDFPLKAEPWPQQPFEAARYHNVHLGLSARDLVMLDRYADQGKVMKDPGVLIFRVVKNSPAAAGPLGGGDIVTRVNGTPVPNVAALAAVLAGVSEPGSKNPIAFLVRRGDTPEAITVIPPKKPR